MRNVTQLLAEKVREQTALNNHLGSKIHRLRIARRAERAINDETRRIDKRLQAAFTDADGELTTQIVEAITDLHDLLIGPELAARAARETRLQAKRDAASITVIVEEVQPVADAATTA